MSHCTEKPSLDSPEPFSLEASLAGARAFAQHIRDPSRPRPLGVPEERMAVYKSLFFNSMTGFLDETYEHLRRLLGDQWPIWQRRFFVQYQAHTPYFHRISSEFLEFIQHHVDFPPALEALARFEQRLYDAEVLAQTVQSFQGLDEAIGLENSLLQLRTDLWLEGFSYDVGQLCRAQSMNDSLEQPLETPQFYCFYRLNQRVVHTLLAPMTVALLTLFEEPKTPKAALTELAKNTGMPLESLSSYGLDFISTTLGALLVSPTLTQ